MWERLVRWWDGESHFRSIWGDFEERSLANPLKINRLSKGNLGPESCVLEGNNIYGHSTTIKCSRQKDPTDRLCHRRTPPRRRGKLWTLQAPACRAKRGPGDNLAGRGEARSHAAGSPRVGDACSRRHSMDPRADGLASGALGIASGGHC